MKLIAILVAVLSASPGAIASCPKDDFACKRMQRNLRRDQMTCDPDPIQVLTAKPEFAEKQIRGSIKYMNLVPLPYRYRLSFEEGKIGVSVRVHFRNASEDQLTVMRQLISGAQEVWNEQRVREDLVFHFEVVEDPGEADFSVKLLERDTRGPYFWRWSTEWSKKEAAHELGHMMGLDDEYPQLLDTLHVKSYIRNAAKWCDRESLMCSSYAGKPTPEHIYLVIRRAFCQ